jgi:isoleucyl-tRNA synthetase
MKRDGRVSVKADFRKLGPKFGPNMKAVAAAIARLSSAQGGGLGREPPVAIEAAGGVVELSADDVVVQRTPKAGMVVASEATRSWASRRRDPALVQECLAREFVSRVQNLRKEADFEVTQRIAVTVACDDEVRAAIDAFAAYAKTETLCERLNFGAVDRDACDLNGHAVRVKVEKM